MQRILIALFVFAVFLISSPAEEGWKAGAAAVTITPDELFWMAGYGSRSAPAEGKQTDLFAKALVLEDSRGKRGLILTLDLVGIDREFAGKVTAQLKNAHGFSREQIALCTSHTHSGPVIGRNLGPLHYWSLDTEQKRKIDAYAEVLLGKLVAVTAEALASLAPARIQSGSGKCTFAVNRRENKELDVPSSRTTGTLEGPSDHDVPVLSIRSREGALKAILFGYACHATVLSGMQWNGDYPGYAQAELEKNFPGAVALFWAGCGGDQNPVPRRELPLAEKYGKELAARVGDVLDAHMPEVTPGLDVAYREIEAPLSPLPTQEDIQKNISSTNRFEVARAKFLLREMEKKGGLDQIYPYPIGVWTIGDSIDFIFLGGEVVVDYALRLKKERRGTSTWVAGYSNDVMAYIPSRRVATEGGYEGGGSDVYYGLPSIWGESLEEDIVRTVHTLAK